MTIAISLVCVVNHAAKSPAQQPRIRSSATDDPSASGGFDPMQQPNSGGDINLMPLPTRPGSSANQSPYYQQPPSSPTYPLQQIPPNSSSQKNQMLRGVPSPATSFGQHASPDSQATDDGPNCADEEGNAAGLLRRQGDEQSPHDTLIPSEFQPGHYPRYLGYGDPLTGTSWRNRPWHVDFFSGSMIGDDAIDGVIGQEAGFWVGTRVGWDYDYYWGVESRLGYSWMHLFDRTDPNHDLGTGNIIDWDMHLLYYPWGDSRWRPFLLVGIGISQFDSFGSQPALYNATLMEVPFGVGMKYFLNEWLALRCDVTDNFAIGTGSLDSMHNISFDAGIEYHFGGHRRDYWPWNPNPIH